jgi:hypothetical protein
VTIPGHQPEQAMCAESLFVPHMMSLSERLPATPRSSESEFLTRRRQLLRLLLLQHLRSHMLSLVVEPVNVSSAPDHPTKEHRQHSLVTRTRNKALPGTG